MSDLLPSVFNKRCAWANSSRRSLKKSDNEQIALDALYKRATVSESLFTKERPWVNLSWFSGKICIFCTFFTAFPFLCPIENCSRHSSPCRSLQKSDHEWFAPVALYIRAMQVICSFSRAHCSFAQKERAIRSKNQRGNSQPCKNRRLR